MRDSADRRREFSERAQKATVAWQFFDACTEPAPGMTYDEREAELRWGRRLTPGEIGCYASHYALWAQLLRDDADQYVILEDDVIVDWHFVEALVQVDFHRSGIDYLRLHCLHPGGMRARQLHYIEKKNLIELREPAYGTQAYLITRSAAERLLDYCGRVLRPVDSQLDRYWEHGIPNLCIFPFPVIEESRGSLIGDQRREWKRRPLHIGIKDRMRRLSERVKRRAWLLKQPSHVAELHYYGASPQ